MRALRSGQRSLKGRRSPGAETYDASASLVNQTLQTVNGQLVSDSQEVGFAEVANMECFFKRPLRTFGNCVDPANPYVPALPNVQSPPGTPLRQRTTVKGWGKCWSCRGFRMPTVYLRARTPCCSLHSTDLAKDVLSRRFKKHFWRVLQLKIAGALVAHNDIARRSGGRRRLKSATVQASGATAVLASGV